MTSPFMDSYVRLLIKTCHKRGVHAMGGMAAQIPIKGDPAANEAALAKVRRLYQHDCCCCPQRFARHGMQCMLSDPRQKGDAAANESALAKLRRCCCCCHSLLLLLPSSRVTNALGRCWCRSYNQGCCDLQRDAQGRNECTMPYCVIVSVWGVAAGAR